MNQDSISNYIQILNKDLDKRINFKRETLVMDISLTHIPLTNESYKTTDDAHRRHVEFNIGDCVMIQLRPKWSPQGTAKKLQA